MAALHLVIVSSVQWAMKELRVEAAGLALYQVVQHAKNVSLPLCRG